MLCSYNIEVTEPGPNDLLFKPFVRFRIEQRNSTPKLMTEGEIDYQIKKLLEEIETLKKKTKKELGAAKARHDKIVAEKRQTAG